MICSTTPHRVVGATFCQAYRNQDAAWLTAIAIDSAVGASARDGYATNAVIDAALASLASAHAEPIIQER